jgi:hypothetical protein
VKQKRSFVGMLVVALVVSFVLVGCVTSYHVQSFSEDIVTLPNREETTILSSGQVQTKIYYDGLFEASTLEAALVKAHKDGYTKLLSIEYGTKLFFGTFGIKWVTIRCSKPTEQEITESAS